MLARRERSEQQVRERLRDKEFDAASIEAAIARLKAERALDDGRFAQAMARFEIVTKRHGRLRALRQLQAAGISGAMARDAVDQTLAGIDHDSLIESALSRRLRGADTIPDQATFQRLYRFLIGQGFESDVVVRTLKKHRAARDRRS